MRALSPLLTIPQAAARLHCSVRSVRRLIETGALPAVRIGRLVRVDPGDLAVLIHTSRHPQKKYGRNDKGVLRPTFQTDSGR